MFSFDNHIRTYFMEFDKNKKNLTEFVISVRLIRKCQSFSFH